jgi:hypothetical protein
MARRSTYNSNLPPLPSDEEVLRALAALENDPQEQRRLGSTATSVAWKLGIQSARRLGRGAVQRSWTGSMAPALRISPRLRSLAKRGLLHEMYDDSPYARSRKVYKLTSAGRKEIG